MPALVGLLIVVPLLELYVLIQVGQVIGALWTVALLLAVSLVGAALLRREGARTYRAYRAAAAAGRLPGREAADGALVILAGALLLTPGFVTDVTGLALLFPPVRAVVRRVLLGRVTRWLLPGVPLAGLFGGLRGSRRGRASSDVRDRPGPGRGQVVDGQVVDGER